MLGFSTCSEEMTSAYGTPTADYMYMGKVTDEDGDPIKGINVILQKHEYGGKYTDVLKVVTDRNGRYSTDYIYWSLTDGISQTGYMKKEKTGAGDGWYAGKYILSDEIRLYHKPAEDNTEEEGDDSTNNENNESNE